LTPKNLRHGGHLRVSGVSCRADAKALIFPHHNPDGDDSILTALTTIFFLRSPARGRMTRWLAMTAG
jgi:hypothetical protein